MAKKRLNQPEDNHKRLRLILSFLIILIIFASTLTVVFLSNSQSKESIAVLMGMAFTTTLFIYLSSIRQPSLAEANKGVSLLRSALISLVVEFLAAVLASITVMFLFPS